MTNYFIIAGEASGDSHAAQLIEDIRVQEPSAVFHGMGGDKMQAAGCVLVRHISDMAFMGVVAVVKNLGKVRENMRIAHQSLLDIKPDVLVLVDYPTFNLKIAEFTRKHLPKTKIVYYIPPKIWAWKTWRVHKIGRLCDRILCIFPFEVEFYKRYGYTAEYVGNPTLRAINNSPIHQLTNSPTHQLTNSPSKTIAILPGSRKHEVEHCLQKMLAAALMQDGYKIVVAAVSTVDKQVYEAAVQQSTNSPVHQFTKSPNHQSTNSQIHQITKSPITIVTDDTWNVVRNADVALVNSGTATLETALLGTPQIAVYHIAVGPLLYSLRRLVFKVPYFTLVNIIAEREVIHEWLAYRFTVSNVARDLHLLLTDQQAQQDMLNAYEEVKQKLTIK